MIVSLSPDLRARFGAVIQEARRVAEDGATEALAAMAVGAAKPYDHMSLSERTFRSALRARGRRAGDEAEPSNGTQQITRLAHEVAYEHWHRMLFARFLAENGLLIAPEFGVAVSLEDCREFAREVKRNPWELAGEWAQEALPKIFAADDPVLRLPLPPETDQKLEKLLESLPAEIFTAQDSLGWTYQYWRSEEKDRINASGAKIGADELTAVTQLFTERYIVLFLLHNTVGAWRAGKVLASDPALARSAPNEAAMRRRMRLASGGGYDFAYLRFVRTTEGADDATAATEGDEERADLWRPVAGSFSDWPRAARDLRVLDPCCGSGHFLIEAFGLLVRLRMEEEGLAVAEAVRAVLRDNLFGLEIDPRCTQIAVFNLALAAWRMAGGWIQLPAPNVACCGIAPEKDEAVWVRLAEEKLEGLTGVAEDPDLFGAKATLARGPLQEGMRRLHRLFRRARELGSLIDPETVEGEAGFFRADYDALNELLDAAVKRERRAGSRNERAVAAAGMARAAKILRGRYTLIATNVPFLARGRQARGLRNFAETHHGDAKGDIATVFVSRILRWLGDHGTQALVTPQNWLFLKSYRKLRERLLKERTWNVVARLGPGAFETISGEVVNVALVILSAGRPAPEWPMAVLNASSPWGQPPIRAAEKARLLAGETKVVVSAQAEQIKNPDAAVMMEPVKNRKLLGRVAHGHQGIATADQPAYGRCFWELSPDGETWTFQQSTVKQTTDFGGREHVFHEKIVRKAADPKTLHGSRKAVRIQGGGFGTVKASPFPRWERSP